MYYDDDENDGLALAPSGMGWWLLGGAALVGAFFFLRSKSSESASAAMLPPPGAVVWVRYWVPNPVTGESVEESRYFSSKLAAKQFAEALGWSKLFAVQTLVGGVPAQYIRWICGATPQDCRWRDEDLYLWGG